jgi:hypothetical protein
LCPGAGNGVAVGAELALIRDTDEIDGEFKVEPSREIEDALKGGAPWSML